MRHIPVSLGVDPVSRSEAKRRKKCLEQKSLAKKYVQYVLNAAALVNEQEGCINYK